MKYTDTKNWERYKSEKQERLNEMDYQKSFNGKFGNKEVREWYNEHNKRIPDLIDYSKPIENQARQAFELREKHKQQARDMMFDKIESNRLAKKEPPKTFDDFVLTQMADKNLTREEACKNIIKTATKTRKSINEMFGLE